MTDAISRLRAWGDARPVPYAALSGVDAHDLRPDVAPRPTPVSEEERADAVAMSIFAAWETRLGPAVFDDDFAASGIASPTGQNATKALLHMLEDVGADRSRLPGSHRGRRRTEHVVGRWEHPAGGDSGRDLARGAA